MSTAHRAGFRGDSRWLSVPALIILGAVAAATFALSYQGLASVSVAAGVAPWVLPLFLDGGILASGLVRAMLRGQRRATWFAVVMLVAATFVSSGINYLAHALKGDPIEVTLTASLAPLFLLGFTELMIYAVVQNDVAERKPRAKRVAKPAPAAAAVPAEPVVAATPRAPQPRPVPKLVSGGAALPFEEALALDEETLLADLKRLAVDPDASGQKSPESAQLSATIWALNERHGHGVTALARIAEEDGVNRFKDRLRKARAKAPIAA